MAYETPEGLLYSKTHEWVKTEGGEATIGISDYAQHALGDIVFVELPEKGRSYAAGESFGAVESVKAASDLYAPVACQVLAVNEELIAKPEIINQQPYAGGWIARVQIAGETAGLLDATAYAQHAAEEEASH